MNFEPGPPRPPKIIDAKFKVVDTRPNWDPLRGLGPIGRTFVIVGTFVLMLGLRYLLVLVIHLLRGVAA